MGKYLFVLTISIQTMDITADQKFETKERQLSVNYCLVIHGKTEV